MKLKINTLALNTKQELKKKTLSLEAMCIISFQYEPTDILGRVVVEVKGGTQSPQNACDLHTKGEPAASSCTFKHRT